MSDGEQLEQRVWTQEERIAASRALSVKKFGEDASPEEFHEVWAKNTRSDLGMQITLQCELTAALATISTQAEQIKHKDEQIREARELLIEDRQFGPGFDRFKWIDKKEAWLTRNALPDTGAETKEDGNG